VNAGYKIGKRSSSLEIFFIDDELLLIFLQSQ
jgi:hypothetical protein